jgi:hypothetical protein
MRTLNLFTIFTVFAMLLTACGATSTPEAISDANGLEIRTETLPNPARVGDVEIILTIEDAGGNPVTGAIVSVYADHTDMTGMDMNGLATEQDNGSYAILANFSMSGNWLLKVDVKTDGILEIQEIALEIQ